MRMLAYHPAVPPLCHFERSAHALCITVKMGAEMRNPKRLHSRVSLMQERRFVRMLAYHPAVPPPRCHFERSAHALCIYIKMEAEMRNPMRLRSCVSLIQEGRLIKMLTYRRRALIGFLISAPNTVRLQVPARCVRNDKRGVYRMTRALHRMTRGGSMTVSISKRQRG